MKWFFNLKTAVKLISAFVIISIILAFVGFYGLSNLEKMNESLDDMYDKRLVPISNVKDMQNSYLQLRVYLLNMNYAARTKQEKADYITKMDEEKKGMEDKITTYGNRTFAQKEHEELYKKLNPSWQAYKKSFDQSIQLSLDGKEEEFTTFITSGEYVKSRDAFNKVLSDLIDFNMKSAEKANNAANALYESSRMITIAVVIASVLLSIVFGYFISRIIARPLNRVVELVGKVAGGDLRETSDIDTKDEIGILAKSVNNMVLSLKNTAGIILASSQSVSAAAQQISASTEEIASGSTSQATAAQTMNELFKELSTAINSVAQNAEQASELSEKTTSIAQEGGIVIRSSIEGMNLVNQQMSRLEEDSNKIGEIIEVIDDIADQTNLLALNAAIEAARAGDQGRGFAVVADEVRKLAERSSEATKQITSIIKGMQENTQQSVKAVGDGVVSSQKTGEAFENIIAMVNESAQKVGEIAAASEEQAAQSSEVMLAIESISAVTQESAASSEETAATAQSLAQLAEELDQAVAIFKIN